MKNINDILFSFKKVKNDYLLFRKILKLFIENNNIKINENKNKYFKKIYSSLLEFDKNKLKSRKINDIKYLYFIGLRKYFNLNKDRNNKDDFEYIVKEVINTYRFENIRWWDLKNYLDSLYSDKIFDWSKDNIYILNRLKHIGITYVPFYDITYQENIKILFENIDYDYINIWENLKSKLQKRNEKIDVDDNFGFSYLSFDIELNIDEEKRSINITFVPTVIDELKHDYSNLFDEIFDILDNNLIEIGDYIEIKDLFINKIYENTNKLYINILTDIVNKIEPIKYEDIEKYKIDKHYEHLIKLEKLNRLEKLLKDKIITFEQYLEALDKIK